MIARRDRRSVAQIETSRASSSACAARSLYRWGEIPARNARCRPAPHSGPDSWSRDRSERGAARGESCCGFARKILQRPISAPKPWPSTARPVPHPASSALPDLQKGRQGLLRSASWCAVPCLFARWAATSPIEAGASTGAYLAARPWRKQPGPLNRSDVADRKITDPRRDGIHRA